MKAWLVLQIAKLATFGMHALAGWVNGETPAYARMMRRRSKKRIHREKSAAEATPGKGDDIIPTAADTYMGFATMREAQREVAKIWAVLAEIEAGGADQPATAAHLARINEHVRDTVRILDESEATA